MSKKSVTFTTLSAGAVLCATLTSASLAPADAAVGHAVTSNRPAAFAHLGPAACTALPKGSTCVFNQMGTDQGDAVVSQNFTDPGFDVYDAAQADDFSFKKPCAVSSISTVGQYLNGAGQADSVNVIFYTDAGGKPGRIYNEQDGLSYSDPSGTGSLSVNISPVLFDDGLTYWVSVVANMSFNSGGEWGWELQAEQVKNPAMWQNPNGGFGICPTWDTNLNCIGAAGDDMFTLSDAKTPYKFIPINQPTDGGYNTGSCPEPLGTYPDGTVVNNLPTLKCNAQHKAKYEVSFSVPLEKLTAGTASWPNWGVPPNTESPTPNILFTQTATSVDINFGAPVKLGGIEAQPEPGSGVHVITADFYSGGVLLGSISRSIDSNGGALLLGAHCLHLGWGKITIHSDVPFAIANRRV